MRAKMGAGLKMIATKVWRGIMVESKPTDSWYNDLDKLDKRCAKFIIQHKAL